MGGPGLVVRCTWFGAAWLLPVCVASSTRRVHTHIHIGTHSSGCRPMLLLGRLYCDTIVDALRCLYGPHLRRAHDEAARPRVPRP